MTPTDRRKRITDVFQLAVAMPPSERHRFVERECRGDNTLMREVEALLSDYQTSYDNPRDVRREPAGATASPPPPMQRIGKYQITKEIGSGGFGRVYSAIDPSFGRIVAIKVMSAPDDPDMVQRFRAEANTVAKLVHKNIVAVYDFDVQDGQPYLVMEYLDGINLQDLIKQNTLSLLEKIEIMSEVAKGLQCAHERGITHRDVKPANIMRLADGTVKIMDFGIARIATENTRLTQAGFIIGTVTYMSPEQFNGALADAQCDIFAFGVTFYELLTGKNPFATANSGETINRIMNVEPPLVSSLVPGCPESIDRIVKGTLAKNREQRYTSLSDVALDAKPIIMELQRSQAGQLYSEANQLLLAGQLDTAQAAVRKVLEFDPLHAAARQLRTQIEQALHRRDAASRTGSLLEKAEKEIRERQLQEAAATLARIRELGPSDPQLRTRLEKAEALIEQSKRADKLIETAREELRNSNLTEAFQAVSEVLTSDPAHTIGKELLQEIRFGMAQREAKRKLQEDMARTEGLLLIGETEQALSLIAEIERNYPNSSEAWALRNRAEAQQAEEIRKRRLTEGTAECKALLRNGRYEAALAKIQALLSDFPSHAELKALQRHATDQLAAERRAAQIAQLKRDAAALIKRREYAQAIRALEAGVATLRDDGELTSLLQSALAGKAADDRNQAIALAVEEANQLRRQGKLEEALKAIERAIQVWGDAAPLAALLKEISAEREERDKRRAVQDALRKAGSLLEQKNPDAAAVLLRQARVKNGEDAEILKLLQLAESQLRSRDRSVRVAAIIDEMRKLAASRRWQEAFDRAEDGLRNFPNDPALLAEREAVRGPLEKERRERAIAETLAKVQPMLDGGRAREAETVLFEANLGNLEEDSRLLDIKRKLDELAAQKEREVNIEKVCQEAIALRGQDRFDDAIRVLDACDVRYPGYPVVAAALAEAKKEREDFRRKTEIAAALARASEFVRKSEFESARYELEEVIRSYPDSRELAEAAARIRSRLEDGERQAEVKQLTVSIEQAIDQRQWGHAVARANAAIEKFPRETVFAPLKRRAEEGKYKAEIDDVEASALAARRAGDLDRAAEIVAAARKRWEKEKRLNKLWDEIEDARAEQGVAAAKALADAGNYAAAGQKVGEVLARRPKFSPALDLAQSIAARQAARNQDEQIRTGLHPLPELKPQPEKSKRTIFIVAGLAVVIAGIGIFIATRSKTPPPQITERAVQQDQAKPALPTQTPASAGGQVSTPLTAGNTPPKAVTTGPAPTVRKDAPQPKTGKAEQKKSETPPQIADAKPAVVVPAPVPAPPPCKMKPFSLADYGDSLSGDLVWTGNLPSGGEIDIHGKQASPGRVQGDYLVSGVPVRLTPPPDVHLTVVPSTANCWDPHVTLQIVGPAPSRITLHWDVLKP